MNQTMERAVQSVQSWSWERRSLLVLGTILAALLFAYWSTVALPYGFSDDYAVMAAVQKSPTALALKHLFGMGRPVQAVLGVGISMLAEQIENLRYARFLTIVGVALYGFYLFRLLLGAGWHRILALCVPLIVSTLPAWQVTIGLHVTMQFERPFLALLSGVAFQLVLFAFDTPSRFKRLVGLSASIGLLTLVMLTYQPDAMFFWVTGAILLFTPQAELRSVAKRLGAAALVMIASLGLGYLGFKLIVSFYPTDISRTGIVSDLVGKLTWFLNEPLPMVLNFYNLDAKRWIGLAVLGFVVFGMWLYFQAPVKKRIVLLVLALTLIPAAFAANLIVAANEGPYRTLPAISTLCAVYVFMALRGVAAHTGTSGQRIANALAVGTALVGILVASYTVNTFIAAPQNLEYKMMRQQLMAQLRPDSIEIYFLQPGCDETAAPRIFSDFGQTSSCRIWVPANATYMLLRDLDPLRANIPVTQVPSSESITPPANGVIIDLRNPGNLSFTR